MLKRRLSIPTNPFFLTVLLFVLQLGLFLWITLRPFSISPPDRSYFILHGQGSYTAYIRESKEGAWSIYNPYTTRPNQPVYVQLLYVFLGKIAQIFSFDPVAIYMVTRVGAGLILFLATYWFIVTILPRNLQSLAVLFTLGLEPGPLVSEIKNIASLAFVRPIIFSYFPQEVVLRHFGLPHHVLAEALGLLLVGSVFLFIKNPWQRLVGIALLTTGGTLIMPAYTMVLVITVFAAWFVWSHIRGQTNKIMPAFVTIIVCLGLVGLFTKLQMDSSNMWKYFNLDEKRWVTDGEVLVNYLSSLLLYLPATIFLWVALLRAWHRITESMHLTVVLTTTWVVGPLLYIPLTHLTIFPLANFRLVDGYAYVPAGILAAMGVREIGRTAGHHAAKIAVILMLAASLFLTVSYTRKAFGDQQRIYTNVYLLREEWDAIRFLTTIPKNSGVMVMKYFGEIIPVYGSARVFLGETPGALDWEQRYQIAAGFYSGQLTDSQARNILSRENISYVYWGQDEKKFFNAAALYPNVLVPVFQNPAATIFRTPITPSHVTAP
ncbi:MAG: hypothetical protein NT149_03765 [Candidatus Gottesmanbacteria bacterium]|nr:hypothetical protein [Candidatus Gottesmanbacteria bacterium]